MNHNSVVVAPYNSEWPKHFIDIAAEIKTAFGENCLDIHHIGSTSVPELAAKPVIDIIPVVQDIKRVDDYSLSHLGYDAMGEYGVPFRKFFRRRGKNAANIHTFQLGNPEIDRHVNFCNYLRTNVHARLAYAELKLKLAKKHSNDMAAYINGKESFVLDIDRQLGFVAPRVLIAVTAKEMALLDKFYGIRDPHYTYIACYAGVDLAGMAKFSSAGEGSVKLLEPLPLIQLTEPNIHYNLEAIFVEMINNWLSAAK